jgi:hypothetical protein
MFVKVTTSDGRPAWLKAEDVSHVYEDWVQLKHNTGAYKLPPGHGESLVRLLCAYGGEQPSGPVDLAEFVEAEKHPLKVVTGPVCSLSEEQLKSMRDVMESLRLGEQIGRTVLAGGDAASPDDFGVDRECEYEWEPGRAWIVELPPTGGPPVYLKPGDKLLPGRRYKVVDKPPAAALYERDAVGLRAADVLDSEGWNGKVEIGFEQAEGADKAEPGRPSAEHRKAAVRLFADSHPDVPEGVELETYVLGGLVWVAYAHPEGSIVRDSFTFAQLDAPALATSNPGEALPPQACVKTPDGGLELADLPPPLNPAGFEFPLKDKAPRDNPSQEPWGSHPCHGEEVARIGEQHQADAQAEKSWRDRPPQL